MDVLLFCQSQLEAWITISTAATAKSVIMTTNTHCCKNSYSRFPEIVKTFQHIDHITFISENCSQNIYFNLTYNDHFNI